MNPLRLFAPISLAAITILGGTALLHAQNRNDCLRLKGNPKLIPNCVEGLLTQSPYHFTLSSMPPGNGMALGILLEQQRHYLSPFSPPQDSVFSADPSQRQGTFESQGASLGLVDTRLALIGSTNLSWVATGSLSWLPAVYGPGQRKDLHQISHDCNKLGILCTRNVLALHFEGTHQHLNTISFYGFGSTSPDLKHTFSLNNTFGNAYGALPVFDWLTIDAGLQVLKPDLPSSSDPLAVSNSFSETQAPGLSYQPTYLHSHAGFSTRPVFDWNPTTNDADDNHQGPLMKKNLLFTLSNGMDYHWYSATDGSNSSFQQFIFNGDQAIELGSNVRRVVYGHDVHGAFQRAFYRILRRACGETDSTAGYEDPVLLKVTDQCDYGKLSLRTSVTVSTTGSNSVVPFYLRPTVGGSDINSQVSLRGFPNYRFRDLDATFVQAEYSVPIRDPIGLLIFYDAGTAGPTFSSLSFAHLRQDAGFGGTLRLQKIVVAQAYLAWGAGHGPAFNFNFSRLF